MGKISVVVSAYNEEKKIEDCLKSVAWADEIILVDNSSSDSTVKIAQKYTSKIFTQPNRAMLNINKNYGFTKATGEWILSLDADERVTSELREEIKPETRNPKPETNGYWIPRKNIIFGKWIKSGMWWPDFQLRLFKKGTGKFPEEHVHEYLKVQGQTEKLKEPLLHENYSSISQFISKMDKIYTENEMEQRLKNGYQFKWIDALKLPISDFLKTFFSQKGYKDGLHGLVLSLLQAFYAEVVFAKIWEKQGFIKKEYDNNFLCDVLVEFKKIGNELQYWVMTSFISETNNPVKKIFYRLLRKYQKKI